MTTKKSGSNTQNALSYFSVLILMNKSGSMKRTIAMNSILCDDSVGLR
ncbi:hypothetical protein [Campylobacter curvus]|nr:hypothetical protein [Campylobacter curvus]